jgi:MEMO1 family protein
LSVRKPAVAGQFYPGTESEIKTMLSELVDEGVDKERVIGAVAPHAGWIYSGRGAGIVYSRIEIPKHVIIMCPNHRGAGDRVSIMSDGIWQMPTGDIQLAEDLAGLIKSESALFKEDDSAHSMEHSLEVHLPFIQHFRPDFKLVPISLGRVQYEECVEIGVALKKAIDEFKKDVLVIASSDMTHFENAKDAKQKDDLAINNILELNPQGLYNTVMENRISMCGVIPTTIMLIYAKEMKAKKASLLDYRNSGDVTGNYSDVVAYASVTVQ